MKTKIFLIAALVLTLNAATQAQTLPSYLPTDGLVGWWPFNGNANDESGNGNDGTVNGATLTADRFGAENNAYTFNGTNCITIPDNSVFNTSSGTWCIWVFIPSSSGGNGYTIMDKGSNLTDAIGIQEFQSAPRAGINWGSGGATLGGGNYIIADGNWHFFVMTWSSNSFSINLDAGSIQQTDVVIGSLFDLNNGLPIRIGCSDSPYWQSYVGSLDDISIYNRALTQEEITALYTGESVNPPTACNPLPANLQNGLVGYWPFCGNANDESGNGNDGTVNGATLTEDRFGVANSAYSFQSSNNNYISVQTSPSLEAQYAVSVSAWVYVTNANSWNQIVCKRFQNGPFYESSYILLESGPGVFNQNFEKYSFRIKSENFEDGPPISDSLNVNSWHLLTGTYDGASISIYYDGNLISQIPKTGEINYSNLPLYFGTTGYEGQYYSGLLDDIGIWNRALSADEVQQLYTLNACTFTVYDTVTVTQTVYDTVTTYTSVTDTLIINTLITELAPPANTNTIKVFPNPANSHITIDYGNFALMNGYQLRIENSLGQQVFQTNITQQSDYLSLAAWGGNGLYFVHIIDPQGNTIDIRKIVLQ
jgi:hypothetical protein